MNKVFFLMALMVGLIFAKPYDIDKPHSSIEFEVKHLSVTKVKGFFDKFEGKIDIDPINQRINVFEGTIDINSLDTKDKKRDDHLKAPDFFDANNFPKASFKMTKFSNSKIYGDITFRGIKKPIVLEVEMSGPTKHPMNKKELLALEIQGKLNRKDFNIGTSFPNMVVSDEVKFNIQLEVYAR